MEEGFVDRMLDEMRRCAAAVEPKSDLDDFRFGDSATVLGAFRLGAFGSSPFVMAALSNMLWPVAALPGRRYCLMTDVLGRAGASSRAASGASCLVAYSKRRTGELASELMGVKLPAGEDACLGCVSFLLVTRLAPLPQISSALLEAVIGSVKGLCTHLRQVPCNFVGSGHVE